MKFRILNCIYAFLGGYFWSPCPLCRKYFGGHERKTGSLMDSMNSGRAVCPDCKNEADRLNRERFLNKKAEGK